MERAPLEWEISLPGVTAAVPVARRFCRIFFSGTAGAFDAEQIASELATLALRHGSDAFRLRVLRRADGGRIEVHDDSTGAWTRAFGPAEEEEQQSGFGLAIVLDLAERAGHASAGVEGQIMWAEIKWP